MIKRRLVIMLAVVAMVMGVVAPASAIIHENVASFCNGGKGVQGDPPGQFNTRGKSFASALQHTGIYTFDEGTASPDEIGFSEWAEDPDLPGPLGLPPAGLGLTPVTVIVDPTRPNAKIQAEPAFWVAFEDEGMAVYLPVHFGDHKAFDNCHNLNS